jgi:phosphate transport system protein
MTRADRRSSDPSSGAPDEDADPRDSPEPQAKALFSFDRRLVQLKRRLVREATLAIGMLEAALDALWRLDRDAAKQVNRDDDRIDREEVAIEQECFNILALHHAFARDFRVLTFILKVNADIERVADHACSIAKIIIRIKGDTPPTWPTALRELGERVPLMCHELMHSVLDEDVEGARALVLADKTIDRLEKQLFSEAVEMMNKECSSPNAIENGMLIYRIGRELERVGDLMTNIAEDVVYLATGEIVRHEEKKKARPGT